MCQAVRARSPRRRRFWKDHRNEYLAEREGFEPPIRLPVCRISSAVLSTTQPPLRGRKRRKHPIGRRLCIQRETAKQERCVTRGKRVIRGISRAEPAEERQLARRSSELVLHAIHHEARGNDGSPR